MQIFKFLAGTFLVAGFSTVSMAHEAATVRPDDHAPAGVMADHVHGAGGLMLGLRLSRDWYGGDMQQGTQAVSDAQVGQMGFSMGVDSMTMDMAMLDLMWAPHDRLTLMVMPMYMKMDMVMEGLPMAGDGMGGSMGGGMEGEHAGHDGHMMPGATHGHSVEGFGDTNVSALISVAKSQTFNLHTTLGLSIPTGTVGLKNANGNFTHYMMQLGSGSWDFTPSITTHGRAGKLGWGAQLGYVLRTGKANASGYRLGDKFSATAWSSYQIARPASLSLRAIYQAEGDISGHYNGPHSHSSPVDLQANYGGRSFLLGAGVNLVATGGALKGVRLGAEYVHPVYQDLNGVQSPRTHGLQLNLSRAF